MSPSVPHGSSFVRQIRAEDLRNVNVLDPVGLTAEMIASGVQYSYDVLDTIDSALLKKGENRLALVVESTNLSAMVGNLLRSGIAKASNGLFVANGPHKYPDLLHQRTPDKNVEIKMAGQNRRPKGHLAKPGYHLTARYVFCDPRGGFLRGSKDGVLVYIWELRFGRLEMAHFTCSNTEGDSGKTANVTMEGMEQLTPIYFDALRCPLSPAHRPYKIIEAVCSSCHQPEERCRDHSS